MAVKEFLGHPRGLAVLCLVVMWEMFSLYGVRALLIFYATKHLGFSQADASQIYGVYIAVSYLTPFFGGMLTDRFLGKRLGIILGGVMMALGYFLLIFPALFIPALGIVALGNGTFKAPITTQVGDLYAQGDMRRDRAYTLFYIAINVGTFFAPLICGTLGEIYGWGYGFAAASAGMVIGIGFYILGHGVIENNASPSTKPVTAPAGAVTASERTAILALVLVTVASCPFWTASSQLGSIIALWADNFTDRTTELGGVSFTIPASWFQALNPFFIFTLAPLLNAMWAFQARRGKEPSAIGKMTAGALFQAAGFALLAVVASFHPEGHASALWIVAFAVPYTLAELYLSPIGQSLFHRIAPPRFASMMMGLWFVTHTVGYYFGGLLGTLWAEVPKSTYFGVVSALSVATALAFWLLRDFLRRATR